MRARHPVFPGKAGRSAKLDDRAKNQLKIIGNSPSH
jgi:hypothetical protein